MKLLQMFEKIHITVIIMKNVRLKQTHIVKKNV